MLEYCKKFKYNHEMIHFIGIIKFLLIFNLKIENDIDQDDSIMLSSHFVHF